MRAGGRYLSDAWALNLENLTWRSLPASGAKGGPPLPASSSADGAAPPPPPLLPAIAGHVAVPWQGNVVIVGGHMKVRCCAAKHSPGCPPPPHPASQPPLQKQWQPCPPPFPPQQLLRGCAQPELCPPAPLRQAKEATPEMPVRLLDSKTAAWSTLACTAADGEEVPRPRGGHSVRSRFPAVWALAAVAVRLLCRPLGP